MKSLENYLFKNINTNIINEDNIIQHFMINFDTVNNDEGVEDYFKSHNLIKDGKIYIKSGRYKGKYFTLDDFKKIYDYAEENQKPCPMIVDYKQHSGHFVLRRWVAELNDQIENIDILEESGAPFDGLHNTSMKEDGKWFPDAEDYEYIIAYAYNKKRGFFNNDVDNISYVMNKEYTTNSKAEQLMEFYAGNQNSFNNIVDALPSDCGKMSKLPIKENVTTEWEKLGNYREDNVKPNRTPKTDIISEKYKISLKKSNGSQLMSGYEQEARATLMSAAEKLDDKSIKEKVESLFIEPWLRNINSNKDIEKRTSAQEYNKKLTSIIRELFENEEFKKQVMLEAASGEVKYGKNSPNTANSIFVWDDVKSNNNKMYTIEEYINHIMPTTKVEVSLKTSDKTSAALRIKTK